MKAKKIITIVNDIVLYAVLVIQLLYVFIGNVAHEILGITFLLCLIVHTIIKRKQLKSLFKFKGKSKARIVSNIVTILLIIACIALMISGLDVSRTLVPWFRILSSVDMHVYLATTVLALGVLHGGMKGFIRSKKKVLAGILIVIGVIASIVMGLAIIPWVNRQFREVSVNTSDVIGSDKVTWNGTKPLVVYFTRVGNTDFDANVDMVSGASLMLKDGVMTGNTHLLTQMIDNAIDCDVRAIKVTGTKYPSSYADTVAVASDELAKNARPAIETIDVSGYDSVILVYPLWWGTIPMPVATFLENNDFAGKKVYVIATQGSEGYGSSIDEIKKIANNAEVIPVMSVYSDDIPKADTDIINWLKGLQQ
ncbi:MAG: hypothetical protein IJU02_05725 [Lachnospiraceae bacterium]|nr:hypothetical protein [Lachnospiraceae bacterium]